jgi:hypothetical protein
MKNLLNYLVIVSNLVNSLWNHLLTVRFKCSQGFCGECCILDLPSMQPTESPVTMLFTRDLIGCRSRVLNCLVNKVVNRVHATY